MLMFLLDNRSRLVVGFVMIGMFFCLFASEVNGMIVNTGIFDMTYITTNLTPAVEELMKAFPILFFAAIVSDDRKTLLSISMAVGIGFAILENAYIMVKSIETVTISWAVVRGIGAGLMHGLCTMGVGLGASFVRKKRMLFVPGTFALLIMAEIYHGCYNLLVQSRYRYAGILLPGVTYAVILLVMRMNFVVLTGKRSIGQ